MTTRRQQRDKDRRPRRRGRPLEEYDRRLYDGSQDDEHPQNGAVPDEVLGFGLEHAVGPIKRPRKIRILGFDRPAKASDNLPRTPDGRLDYEWLLQNIDDPEERRRLEGAWKERKREN